MQHLRFSCFHDVQYVPGPSSSFHWSGTDGQQHPGASFCFSHILVEISKCPELKKVYSCFIKPITLHWFWTNWETWSKGSISDLHSCSQWSILQSNLLTFCGQSVQNHQKPIKSLTDVKPLKATLGWDCDCFSNRQPPEFDSSQGLIGLTCRFNLRLTPDNRPADGSWWICITLVTSTIHQFRSQFQQFHGALGIFGVGKPETYPCCNAVGNVNQ